MAINNGLIYLPAWNPEKKTDNGELNLFLFYSGKLCNRGYREKKKNHGREELLNYWRGLLKRVPR